MPAISGLGPASAGMAPLLTGSASGLTRSAGAALAGAAPNALELALRKNVDDAFAQGGSLSDIAGRLEPQIAETLQQYGASDQQRSSVLDQLRQMFAQGGEPTQVRQSVSQLLSAVAQSIGASNHGPPSMPGGSVGQAVDFSA
jgi:hypothetical protein